MKKLVYLAGAISGLQYGESVDWRERACKAFASNIHGLSPMRAKDYLAKEAVLKDEYTNILSTQKAIMARDSFDVRRCDMLIVNLLGTLKVSIGTMLEVGMAYALNKPVVLVMEANNNLHDHSMVRETAGWRVETLDDAIMVVNAVLGEA